MSNSAPIYKIEEKTNTMPEYTIDNYIARREWNKEISNNKQGYMGVDIMSMKDFYDAGGYSFVDDYRAELQQIDAEYDRALPGYGVRGEQMASAGLTGSGFGDYLSGQAYATRAQGQAVARRNIMANSNSFRAAYNSYVTQQKEKREQNLQTVIEKAYDSAMDPEMFVEMATKLGIPQADAERGKGILEGYYMGYGAPASVQEKMQTIVQKAYDANLSGDEFKEYARAWGLTNDTYLTKAEEMLNALYAATPRNEFGLTDAEQTQASSLTKQIISGVGTYQNTDAIKNLLLATSTNKNAESIYNAALQQAKMAVMTELQGMIENGEFYTTEELAKIKAYYGFTDEELKTVSEKMQTIEKEAEETTAIETGERYAQLIEIGFRGGEIKIDEDTTQTIKAEDYDDVDDIVRNLLGIQDMNDPAVKKGIEIFQNKINAGLADDIAEGKYVSKSALDSAKKFGAISDVQYQTLLGSAQEKTAKKIVDAIMNGYADDEFAALEYLGIDVSSVDDTNCENLLIEAVEEAYKNGDITREQKKEFDEARWQNDISMIQDLEDLEKTIITIKQQKGTIEETAKCFNITSISYGAYNHKGGFDINLRTENGTKITVPVLLNSNTPMEVTKKISAEIESAAVENHNNVVQYKGALYTKKNGYWYSLRIDDGKNPIDANNSKSQIKDWLYQFFDAETQKEMSDKTKNELQNTLNVT